MAGLTKVSKILSSKTVDGVKMPCEGQLFYRGYNIYDLVGGVVKDSRFGYEEIAYLLLFGELPNKEQMEPGFPDTRLQPYPAYKLCQGTWS